MTTWIRIRITANRDPHYWVLAKRIHTQKVANDHTLQNYCPCCCPLDLMVTELTESIPRPALPPHNPPPGCPCSPLKTTSSYQTVLQSRTRTFEGGSGAGDGADFLGGQTRSLHFKAPRLHLFAENNILVKVNTWNKHEFNSIYKDK